MRSVAFAHIVFIVPDCWDHDRDSLSDISIIDKPAGVVMYRCFGLRGLSGMDRSSNPADRSGSRYCLRKCSRSLIAATACNFSLDFSAHADAWSIARTCGVSFSSANVRCIAYLLPRINSVFTKRITSHAPQPFAVTF